MTPTLAQIAEKITDFNATKGVSPLRVLVMQPGGTPLIDIGSSEPHDPASLTKLMTLYVALKSWNGIPETTTISPYAADAKILAKHNPKYQATRVRDTLPFTTALQAIATASDNVVSAAVAEALGMGDAKTTPLDRRREFVVRMNETAKDLGMQNTRFANVSGLPVEPRLDRTEEPSTTTASDMWILLSALYRDFPQQAQQYLESSGVKYGHLKDARTPNHSLNDPASPASLRDIEGMHIGAKTGYTNRAHHSIAAMATDKDGNQLGVVVLGSDWTAIKKVLGLVEVTDLPSYYNPKSSTHTVKGTHLRDALVERVVRSWHAETEELQRKVCPRPGPTIEALKARASLSPELAKLVGPESGVKLSSLITSQTTAEPIASAIPVLPKVLCPVVQR